MSAPSPASPCFLLRRPWHRQFASALAAVLLTLLTIGCSSDGGGSSSGGGRVAIDGDGVFSATLVGEQRAGDFVIVNDSTKPVRLDAGSVSVTGDSAFRVLGSITGTLDPGEDLTARVIYEPATTGDHQATLTVRPRGGKVTSVALSGRGVDQAVTMSVDGVPVADAARHDFGDVAMGAEASVTIAFTNHTSDPASFGAVDLSGSPQFAITDALAGEVAGESTVNMTVSFAPTSDEGVNASLQVPVTGDTTFTVDLAGGYVLSDPRLAVYGEGMFISESDSTPSVDDGTHFVDPGEQTFVFANETAFPVTVDEVTIAGSSTAAFASRGWSDGLTGQQTVQPGDTRGFAIAFLPSSSGTFSAEVAVPVMEGGASSTYDFNVSGESDLQGVLQLTGSGAFGPLLLPDSATQVVELANVGGLSVTVASSDVILSGDSAFSLMDFAGGELAPGDTMAVSISYAPQAPGEHAAVLEAATANASTATLDLSGSANDHPLALTIDGAERQPPYNHDFGIVTPPASKTVAVVIHNLFTTTIDLGSASVSGPAAFGATQPAETNLAPGDSTTLQLSYTPSVMTPEDGVVTLAVSGFDDITIAVAGGFESDDPRIAVYGNDVFIAPGDGGPQVEDGTHFTDVSTHEFVFANETRFAVTPGQPVMISGEEHFSAVWSNPADPAEVASGSQRSFTVSFHPQTSDAVQGEVQISTGTDDPSSYVFAVSGEAAVPVMQVAAITDSGSVLIEDHGTGDAPATNSPTLEDGTDYGRWQVNLSGTPLVQDQQQYLITNVGSGALELTGGGIIDLLGPDAVDWTVVRFPAETTLDTQETTTFTIAYRPVAAGSRPVPGVGDQDGERSQAVVRIASNSADDRHSLYQINVAGTRINTGLVVTGFGSRVNHGSQVLSDFNGTNFNAQPVGGSGEHPFVVTNASADTITLAQDPLVFADTDASQHFQIGSPLTGGMVLAPGDTTGFSVVFSPVDVGQFLTHVHLRSDDSAAPSYDMVLGGRGRGPRLEVTWITFDSNSGFVSVPGADAIERGDLTPDANDGTILDREFIVPTEGTKSNVFLLTNTGNENLLFGDGTGSDLAITGLRAGDYGFNAALMTNPVFRPLDAQTLSPVSVLAPGDSAVISVDFRPTERFPNAVEPEKDERLATIVIRTNEPTVDVGTQDGIFDFAVLAEAFDPIVGIRGRNLVIPDDDTTPNVADDTAFRDVDFNGGSALHEFVMRNLGTPTFDDTTEVYASLTQPTITGMEQTNVIRSEELHPTFRDPVDNGQLTNVIEVPGTPNGSGGASDAAVLARLRVGDSVQVTGSRTGNNLTANIDYIWPNVQSSQRRAPYNLVWDAANLETDVFHGSGAALIPAEMRDADTIQQVDHLGRLDTASISGVPLKGLIAVDQPLSSNRMTGWQVLMVTAGASTANLHFPDTADLRNVVPGATNPVSLLAGDWIEFQNPTSLANSLTPNATNGYEVQSVDYGNRVVTVHLTAPSASGITASNVAATTLSVDSQTIKVASTGPVQDAFAAMIKGTSIIVNSTTFTVEEANANDLTLKVAEDASGLSGGMAATLVPAQPVDLIIHENLTFTKVDFTIEGTLPPFLDPIPGEEASFGVRFTPRWSTGFESGGLLPSVPFHFVTVNVGVNDVDATGANYNFRVSGTAADPDIATRNIDSGLLQFTITDDGLVDEEILLGRFRVENIQPDATIAGNLRLNSSTPVTLAGPHAEEYRIRALNAQTIIPADGSGYEFEIYFMPRGTGTREAQLLIPSNDAERPVHVMSLLGNGVVGINN